MSKLLSSVEATQEISAVILAPDGQLNFGQEKGRRKNNYGTKFVYINKKVKQKFFLLNVSNKEGNIVAELTANTKQEAGKLHVYDLLSAERIWVGWIKSSIFEAIMYFGRLILPFKVYQSLNVDLSVIGRDYVQIYNCPNQSQYRLRVRLL